MDQTFRQEGVIKAVLTKLNSRGRVIYDWVIEDEKNACKSCLICNQYKYNHNNIAKNYGKFVHICLKDAPEFIDITNQLIKDKNVSCQFFNRRAIG